MLALVGPARVGAPSLLKTMSYYPIGDEGSFRQDALDRFVRALKEEEFINSADAKYLGNLVQVSGSPPV